MVEQLLDFDRSAITRQNMAWGWKEIAWELGVSEDTIQRWCKARGLELPRWGGNGKRRRVFLPKAKILLLRAYFTGHI